MLRNRKNPHYNCPSYHIFYDVQDKTPSQPEKTPESKSGPDWFDTIKKFVSDAQQLFGISAVDTLANLGSFTIENAKTLANQLKRWASQSQESLTAFFNSLSKEEKQFVEYITGHLKNQYLIQPVLSALNVSPFTLALFIIAMNATPTAAQANTGSTGSLTGTATGTETGTATGTGTSPEEIFFKLGTPVGAKNPCAEKTFCSSFFASKGSRAIAPGSIFLENADARRSRFETAWECSKEAMTIIENMFENPKSNPFGEAPTCSVENTVTRAASINLAKGCETLDIGRGIVKMSHVIDGLSPAGCQEAQTKLAAVQECMQKKLDDLYANVGECSEPSKHSSSIWYWFFIFLIPLLLGIQRGAVRRCSASNESKATQATLPARVATGPDSPDAASAPVTARGNHSVNEQSVQLSILPNATEIPDVAPPQANVRRLSIA